MLLSMALRWRRPLSEGNIMIDYVNRAPRRKTDRVTALLNFLGGVALAGGLWELVWALALVSHMANAQ